MKKCNMSSIWYFLNLPVSYRSNKQICKQFEKLMLESAKKMHSFLQPNAKQSQT